MLGWWMFWRLPTWWLWALFWGYWGLMARGTVKEEKVREPMGRRLLHVSAFLGAFVVLALPPGFLNLRLLQGPFWFWTGLALQLLGFAWAVWARVHLGRYWSGRIVVKAGQRVVRSGPYAWVRHPIYSGILLQMLGSSLMVGTILALLASPLLYVRYRTKVQAEEQMLLQHLGAEYAGYQRAVAPLVPGLRGRA